jgi:hypothetical protein
MPRGRSTFTKRQKEQTRQQKQRQGRAQGTAQAGKPEGAIVDEMQELRNMPRHRLRFSAWAEDEPGASVYSGVGKLER